MAVRVLPLLALGAQLVADLAGAEQDALGVADLVVGEHVLEAVAAEVGDGETASLWRSMLLGVNTTSGLRHGRSACRRSRWKYCAAVEGWQIWMLSSRGELQVALDARAGVLRPLAFVAVRQQHDDAGEQTPLVLAGGDELVDDDLRAVGEVAELRLPEHQRLGIVAAEAVLEAEHRRLPRAVEL